MVQPPAPTKWHGVPGFISWPWMVPVIQPSQQAVHGPQERDGAGADPPETGGGAVGATGRTAITLPQHCLYFLPLPQEQGSLRPGFIAVL